MTTAFTPPGPPVDSSRTLATQFPTAADRNRPARFTILLVEDDLPDARLTTEWLTQEGAHGPIVLDATSITEARAVIAACRVDCIVLDLGLPDASGTGALSSIVEAAPGVPVVVLTASDDDALDLRLLHLGAADFVPKGPAQGELLRRTVRYAIERARAKRAQRDSEERFRVAFQDGPVATGIVSLTGRVTLANVALCRLLGRPETEVVDRSLGDFVHPDDREEYEAQLTAATGGAATQFESEQRFLRPDNSVVWGCLHGGVVASPDGLPPYAVVQVEDVTDRHLREEELLHRATHDPLTGLGNRRLVRERLSDSLRRAARSGLAVAVLYCDLDGFKQTNDLLGHDGADQVLVAAAHGLRRVLRPGDTVGRVGGDEFVMICEDIASEREAVALAERVLAHLRQTSTNGVGLAASIGVALGAAGSDPAVLLRHADEAMFAAKRAGRNRVRTVGSVRS